MQGQPFDSNRENTKRGAGEAALSGSAQSHTALSFLDIVAVDDKKPVNRSPVAATASAADKARICASSPEYEQRIDDVARRIFDPAMLGDLKQLKTKYNCQIERSNDPIKYVKLALDVDDKDPYTSYLTPDAYKKIVDMQRGDVVGVGVSFVTPTALEDKSGKVPPLIVQSYDGTDARGRGLLPGDRVLAIDGVSMEGKTWRDGLKALDGPDRSPVGLRIMRDGKVSDIVLTRTNEEPPNVTSEMVDGKFAHIKVKTFMNQDTAAQIEKAILDNPKAQGFILDLRNNGGGLLDQAFTSASLFIKEGKVLTIKSRVPSDPAQPQYENDVYSVGKDLITKTVDNGPAKFYAYRHPDRVDKPVVVLVDQGTASAAEILAGALKDSDNAYVVGTPTFGKGIGQAIIPDRTAGGATKITTFRYYTPSGFWPGDGHDTRIGLQPNLVVDNPTPRLYNTANDGQINAAIGYLRTKQPVARSQH